MAHTAPGAPATPGAHGLPGLRALSGTWAVPALLAVVYGLWAAAIHRDGGPITGGNVLFGVVAGVVFGALYVAVRRVAPALPRELRAAAWAAFAGVTFGFLYSLTDATVLRSVGMAVAVAAGVFAMTFYRYYTRE
ncbi:hypothetical protein ABT390_12420 [Streptomyces aurantiacus]|uniref:Integral membrane protein n=1 Tax=Streptomyces aurantiacus JA 4570 TaxID=1286094 RepID=S3ZPU4_9ACTN|nr:hypothetical protein [Streptomyces aurantiacus]EPH40385.1 hypothetical protein STRAU_6551 [Streptomyces aurantiacus JA 4570]